MNAVDMYEDLFLDGINNQSLKQFRYLAIKSKRLEEKLERLRTRAERITQIYTDMPKGGKHRSTWDELIDVTIKTEEEINNIEILKDKVEEWINECPNVFVQVCMGFYYVDGLTWRQVANRVGGGNKPNGCRMAVMRYLGVYE